MYDYLIVFHTFPLVMIQQLLPVIALDLCWEKEIHIRICRYCKVTLVANADIASSMCIQIKLVFNK